MSIALLLQGSCTVVIPPEHRTAAMNLCMQMGLPYAQFRWREDGGISFRCSVLSARRFLAACRARDIQAEALAYRGVPRFLKEVGKRAGLVAGAFLALALVIASGLFVWDVQVSGNESLSEEAVIAELRACGFGVGSYLPTLQVRDIENRVLMSSDRIGWISINTQGTVAQVQVIEHVEGIPGVEGESNVKLPANLIANGDGQIEYLELYRGNAVVKVGQAVKKGELLVSGLYDSQTGSFRYTRAAGRVMARTERVLQIEIPLSYEEKIYEEPVLQDVELCFFNFSRKIFKNSGNAGVLCDIIKYNSTLGKLGYNRLPVSLVRTFVRPYHTEWRERSAEQALALCYEQLGGELSALSREVQLLQKEIITEIGEGSVILTCTIVCIENIAQQQEFEIA